MLKQISILLLVCTAISAQNNDFFLSADSLEKYDEVYLGNSWKYKPGDSLGWAKTDLNDSDWAISTTTFNAFETEQPEFTGKGWFRLNLTIDTSLINKPLAFVAWFAGAAEVYINGEQVSEYGKIENGELKEKYVPLFPEILSLGKENNVIAIRYFNDLFEEMQQKSFSPGFFIQLGEPNSSVNNRYDYISRVSETRIIFITIALALALVHIFLFIFDPKQIQNLFYVLFLLFFSAFLWINLSTSYGNDVGTVFFLYRFGPAALIFTIVFGSTTIYSIYKKVTPFFKYIIAAAMILSVLGYLFSEIVIWYFIYGFISLVSYWGSTNLYSPRYSRKTPSDWILRIGFAVMGLAGIYQMLLSLGVVGMILGIYMPFIYGVVVFVIAMSIALARDYATTSKNLEKKLVEVKELSDKTLEQELEAKELEVQKRILESDNKRKTDELEAARSVQLAMLPQCLNDIEGLDICFDMRPATEVGGDYYDYNVTKDGTLNLVIGDATGHGMKAGIMVATIKSLFSALGVKMMIPDFFNKCTEIIKSMSLGNLFMSMTFLRIKGEHILGSMAGMPPLLIYRKEKNDIEEFVQKSMPLGAPLNFPYDTFETEFKSGDIILLMSDGFIELFNAEKKLLGNAKTKEYFLQNVDSSADDLVSNLFEKAKEWRKDHPQEDDITFVAIKKI